MSRLTRTGFKWPRRSRRVLIHIHSVVILAALFLRRRTCAVRWQCIGPTLRKGRGPQDNKVLRNRDGFANFLAHQAKQPSPSDFDHAPLQLLYNPR